jgi:hypothetical protein
VRVENLEHWTGVLLAGAKVKRLLLRRSVI